MRWGRPAMAVTTRNLSAFRRPMSHARLNTGPMRKSPPAADAADIVMLLIERTPGSRRRDPHADARQLAPYDPSVTGRDASRMTGRIPGGQPTHKRADFLRLGRFRHNRRLSEDRRSVFSARGCQSVGSVPLSRSILLVCTLFIRKASTRLLPADGRRADR